MNENHSHTVGLDSLDRFRKHFAASLTTPLPYGSSRSLVFSLHFFVFRLILLLLPSCNFIVLQNNQRDMNIFIWNCARCNDFNSIWMNFRKIVGKWLRVCVCVNVCLCTVYPTASISYVPGGLVFYNPFLFSILSLHTLQPPLSHRSSVEQHPLYKYKVQIRKQTRFLFRCEGVCVCVRGWLWAFYFHANIYAIAMEPRCSQRI